MDCSINYDFLMNWIIQYGSIALFFLLVFGIIALPIPEETLMVFSGILIKKGTLGMSSTLLAAYGGSICGISLSYLLGCTAGTYLLSQWGKKAWVIKHHERTVKWFERFGKWALLIGYFIPGVRHFTGFLSGTLGMKFKQFAVFAYTGAIIWASFFIFFGFFFGNYCLSFLEELDIDFNIIIISALVLAAIYLILSKRKSK